MCRAPRYIWPHPCILIFGMLCRQVVVCEDAGCSVVDAGPTRQRPVRTQHKMDGAGANAGRQFMVSQLAATAEDPDVETAGLTRLRRELPGSSTRRSDGHYAGSDRGSSIHNPGTTCCAHAMPEGCAELLPEVT